MLALRYARKEEKLTNVCISYAVFNYFFWHFFGELVIWGTTLPLKIISLL